MVRRSVTALLMLASLAACGGPSLPDTANGIIDQLERAGVVACRERREPVPDVVTCEDDEAGDITVGLTSTGADTVRSTAATVDGPWIVGDSFVVITYDNDADRARSIRDELGVGELTTVDAEGNPEPLGPAGR